MIKSSSNKCLLGTIAACNKEIVSGFDGIDTSSGKSSIWNNLRISLVLSDNNRSAAAHPSDCDYQVKLQEIWFMQFSTI